MQSFWEGAEELPESLLLHRGLANHQRRMQGRTACGKKNIRDDFYIDEIPSIFRLVLLYREYVLISVAVTEQAVKKIIVTHGWQIPVLVAVVYIIVLIVATRAVIVRTFSD